MERGLLIPVFISFSLVGACGGGTGGKKLDGSIPAADASTDAPINPGVDAVPASDGRTALSGNYAVELAGSLTSFVNVGNVTIPADFTLELWVKVAVLQPAGTENVIIAKEVEGMAQNQFRVTLRDGYLCFLMTDPAANDGGLWNGSYVLRTVQRVALDVWSHVAITKADKSFVLYLNGIPQASFTTSVTLSHASPVAMRFGGRDSVDPNWFRGAVDEVRLWKVARPATDIQADMSCPIAKSRADFALLGAYWPLDEGTGAVTADARGTWNGVLSSALWSQEAPLPCSGPSVPPDAGQGASDVGAADRPASPDASDVGALDSNVDAGGSPHQIFWQNPTPTVDLSIPYDTWRSLADMSVESSGAPYFFMLNVPDVFTSATGGLGTFAIYVDDKPLALTYFQSGAAGQRLPITVVGVMDLPAGWHIVTARGYCATANQTVTVGTQHAIWLIAMRASGAQHSPMLKDLAYSPGYEGPVGFEPTDMKIVSKGGDYLLVLHLPEAWMSQTGGWPVLAIEVEGAAPAMRTGQYGVAFPNQRVPFTLFGAATLPAGEHAVSARIRYSTGSDATMGLGAHAPAWLIALPIPSGIAYGYNDTDLSLTTGNAALVEPPPRLLSTTGGSHLFILNAPDTLASPAGAWAAYFLSVDGAYLAGANFSSASGPPGHPVSTTVVGVKELGAGWHSIESAWGAGGGTAFQSAGRTRVIGL